MGLTMAEAFILLAFTLLMLLAFWRWQVDRENTEAVRQFKRLPPAAQAAALTRTTLVDGAAQPDMVVLPKDSLDDLRDERDRLKVENYELSQALVEHEDRWRFMSEADMRRLAQGAARLPEDIRRELANLVEASNASDILSELGELERIIDAGQSLSGIAGRIDQLRDQEADIAAALSAEIGDLVKDLDGNISADGAITLPENVLFARGSANISPSLGAFLDQACDPWLRVLRSSGIEISEVRIEGHASSEWAPNSTTDEAYLGNLGLSQARSQNVLLACLSHVGDDQIREWARKHLVAVGHASARPVLDANGREDVGKSRRVVFRAVPDREKLLDDIGSEAGAARVFQGYRRDAFGTWDDPDGNCINTRHEILKARSSQPATLADDGCSVISGAWIDAYSGLVETSAEVLDIDHVVPLAWAWGHGADSWSDEERHAFFDDPANLAVTSAEINRQKSDHGPDAWLPPDESRQCGYIATFLKVTATYALPIPAHERRDIGLAQDRVCN